jgi:catechol 2,3-dioxygenase-like lactoylglutathione lyase family enzyme
MPYSGLDHVGFAVGNLDRAVEWYTRFLAAAPILRKTWDIEYVSRVVGYPGVKLEAAFWTLAGGTTLELIEYLEPPPGVVDMETYNAGNAHLCLVVDDLDADLERLHRELGMTGIEAIEIPWGPYAGGKACYLRDADGISIELLQRPPGGPRFADPGR